MLRQRRSQIIEDKIEEERIKGVIKKTIVGNQHSSHMIKTVLIVITALICTIGALIRYNNPKIFNRFWKKPIPPFQLATRYPANTVLERDLPRFFGQYAIATPENRVAREAVKKVVKDRYNLRKRAGRIKTSIKAWDDSNVELLLEQKYCGDDFESAYRSASQQRKDDMLMWCLLASRITEGFFKESLEMIDSPLFLTRKRGIVMKRQPPAGVEDGYGALSTSFYMHPRSSDTFTIDWIPSKILSMLVSSSEQEVDVGGQEEIERLLYDLVITQGNENKFVILEEVCQESRPERSIAFDTSNNAGGCFYVVPKKYGGNFDPIED